MRKINISAPWVTYHKKVKALFEGDPDITVGELFEPEDDSTNYGFDLEIRSHKKFEALNQLLPKVKTFGNVTLGIFLYDEENLAASKDSIALFKAVFEGNPLVKAFHIETDHTGTPRAFVIFHPQVIQFFNDDTSDYNGNWSGLAQDIAREVFADEFSGVYFCTAAVTEAAKS